MPFPLRLDPRLREQCERLAAAEGRNLTNFLLSVLQHRVDGGLEAGERYSYTRQKFWEAVGSLVGDGAMPARLGYAYMSLLILRPDEDLPESMRDKFRTLMAELGKHVVHPSNAPPRINLQHPDSDRAADMILSMYVELKGGI